MADVGQEEVSSDIETKLEINQISLGFRGCPRKGFESWSKEVFHECT